MCGITGIALHDSAPVDRELLRSMRGRIAHRGPDDTGEFFSPGIGFGFQRLSIIDPSPAGHQPMTNDDGSIAIVFNGEIYNFLELRRDLEQQGCHFRSRTDTEVLLRAYETFGTACVQRLRGMFAFAVWDQKNRQLFLARDRFGKKPLVYARKNGNIAFASEIQALLPWVHDRSLNTKAIPLYFRFQGIPSPHTIYQSIQKLPPAHALIWKDGKIHLERYWNVPFTTKSSLSLEEAGDEFEQRFRKAVQLRLTSDVPLGAFLSGGLDSTIVTALMSEYLSEPVKTFSIGFGETSHNELPLAKQVAERYHTDHHEFRVTPDVIETLPMLLRHYGEPFADSSALATFYIARETKRFVTVALTGDGGDENFAGYEKYSLLLRVAPLSRIPTVLRSALRALLWPVSERLPGLLGHKVRMGSQLFAADLLERYGDTFGLFFRSELRSLLRDDMVAKKGDVDTVLEESLQDLPETTDLIDRLTALDLRFYLPEILMTKTDIATMANSLEARSPFLDHEVIEFTATLPTPYKIWDGQKKYLLRRQFGHLIPPALLKAPKHGFDLPVHTWLRGSLAPYLEERLSDPSFLSLPYFQHKYIQRLLREHRHGRAHHGIRLWALLCFAVWYEGERS